VSILDLVTSANIACGGHAGDDETMLETVRASAARGVRIGAHPSYPDRSNFGRVSIDIAPAEIAAAASDQVARLRDIAAKEGARVAYIKPHGALYNDAAVDPAVGKAMLEVAARFDLPLMVLEGSTLEAAAGAAGISEGFIDRGYGPDGALLPRSETGALITDPRMAARHALELAPRVASLCVHSDTPGAVQLIEAARSALEEAGYEIEAR
jgi:UPF0271 protein